MGEVVYGPFHAKSILGIMKMCEIMTCLIAVILVAVDGGKNNLINAFFAGTIIGIIMSLLIFVLSLTEAGHSLNGVLKFQFAVHTLLFIYIIIVSSIMTHRAYPNTYKAGGAFGLIAGLFYLIDAVISYKSYGIRIM